MFVFLCFPGDSDGKETACNAGDLRSIPGSGRFPAGGNGNPLQCSCLENSMDRGAWQATVHRVTKSWIRLRTNSFLPFCLPLPTFSSPKTMQPSFLDLLALFLCMYDDLGWPKSLLTLIIFPCWKYGNRTTFPSIPITLHYPRLYTHRQTHSLSLLDLTPYICKYRLRKAHWMEQLGRLPKYQYQKIISIFNDLYW